MVTKAELQHPVRAKLHVYPNNLQLKQQKDVKKLKQLLKVLSQDPDVFAAFLFGSAARTSGKQYRDLDICLLFMPDSWEKSPVNFFLNKLSYIDFGLDVHFFHTLPLYIRHRVVKEGKLLFTKNEDLLYEAAFDTLRKWEDLKPYYQEYLAEMLRSG